LFATPQRKKRLTINPSATNPGDSVTERGDGLALSIDGIGSLIAETHIRSTGKPPREWCKNRG
jgi:hypothetical protein